MRSTRGKTRAGKRAGRHHYTDRLSAPVHSNSPEDSRKASLPMGNRGDWGSANTNLQLSRGGISSYYRSRERGYSLPSTGK